ncbi:hypothetical protein [Chitinimonas sp. BJB300]|uniref:hypothetical protein n=1 Tax=Chitinimonas sp. BJB300 TaxID=1559339 RepID=UPI000C10C1CF|nr:hypothetical protein [Chitinimonas sp. BJB300]PHV12402.1 hypothetical protein CSQ89_05800 [Chitinimonas sp. BJB300]TSJ88998.1 hypothetical protein FG002_008920 [Chitinimonas sp. BJB300]
MEYYLSATYAKQLPQPSAQRSLAILSLRGLWHTIFDLTPLLQEKVGEDSGRILDPFLDYAEAQSLSMNWALHLHFLEWLLQNPEEGHLADQDVVQEMLTAAGRRWAKEWSADLGGKGIAIYCSAMPTLAIGTYRKHTPAETHFRSVALSRPGLSNFGFATYAITTQGQGWRKLSWRPIPN